MPEFGDRYHVVGPGKRKQDFEESAKYLAENSIAITMSRPQGAPRGRSPTASLPRASCNLVMR